MTIIATPGSGSSSPDSEGSGVADRVDETVEAHDWFEPLLRIGWVAKGVVYTLMGIIAVGVARQERTDDSASPEGALAHVLERSGGRLLLLALTIGLILYAAWRFLSVAVIRSHDLKAWLERIGYSFSAAFYGFLAVTAAQAVLGDADPEQSNTVERASRWAMSMPAGRWMVGIAGAVTIAVGLYFVVSKGLLRSFVSQLRGVDATPRPSDREALALVVTGVVGWLGRGVVTLLVGFFVLRAAWRFDPDEAHGFDRSLREVATTGTGSLLVLAVAVGLVAYGVFCLASAPRRELEESS